MKLILDNTIDQTSETDEVSKDGSKDGSKDEVDEVDVPLKKTTRIKKLNTWQMKYQKMNHQKIKKINQKMEH